MFYSWVREPLDFGLISYRFQGARILTLLVLIHCHQECCNWFGLLKPKQAIPLSSAHGKTSIFSLPFCSSVFISWGPFITCYWKIWSWPSIRSSVIQLSLVMQWAALSNPVLQESSCPVLTLCSSKYKN